MISWIIFKAFYYIFLERHVLTWPIIQLIGGGAGLIVLSALVV
jgi:hypothetical protein